MQLGTTRNLSFCGASLNSQRMSIMTFVLKKIALRSRFFSLNHQFQALMHSLKHKDKAKSLKEAQEAYWYETACLLEESRRLKLRFPNPFSPRASFTNFFKGSQTFEEKPLYAQILTNSLNQTPSIISIVILSLLHGISIVIGIFWLIFPQLMD